MKNMMSVRITGASQADVSLIMVLPCDCNFTTASAKGNHKAGEIQGQTRQHSRLINLLDVKQIAIGCNKTATPLGTSLRDMRKCLERDEEHACQGGLEERHGVEERPVLGRQSFHQRAMLLQGQARAQDCACVGQWLLS